MLLMLQNVVLGIMLLLLNQALDVCCANSDCDFRNYVSSCDYKINNQYPVQITGVINRCHNPVDVTLDIQSTTSSIDWTHTFINQHEILVIHGFPHEVKIYVVLLKLTHDILHIKAEFHVESSPGPYFIDSNVTISSSYSCSPMSSGAGTATLAVFVVILIALITVVPLIVWWRRRQHRLATSALVDNMEQCSPDRVFHDKNSVELRSKSPEHRQHPNDDKQFRKNRAAKIKDRLKGRLSAAGSSSRSSSMASSSTSGQRTGKRKSEKNKRRDFPHVTVTRSEEVTVDVNALREYEIC
ncbi:uncharacterized protein LOC141911080 [Tubulanus polymorphus]|uniref:uncharacterized protein LOC141911080 n=1 Tax=Tubulanus polymorphus TaxID=672921 RepID=UPI003DA42262